MQVLFLQLIADSTQDATKLVHDLEITSSVDFSNNKEKRISK